MTKNILMATVAITALVLSGCSSKKPKLDPGSIGNNNINDATQIVEKTVSIDENTYGNESTKVEQTTTGNESDSNVLNSHTNVNSSTNGFKSLYFGFGEYGIATSMDTRMSVNIDNATKQSAKIKIEGNCDEFGTDEYNYALGLKRAKAVKDNMVAQGIDAKRMIIVSFGESNPVCSNPTDGCYAQNRRVDLRLAK